MSRLEALVRLYALLDRLESKLGCKCALDRLGPARGWPDRGVYFFFEPGEFRTDSGTGPRLVRVGTHALRNGTKSTLHQRLRQHGGQSSGGGNHRGSIFRLLIGEALLAQEEPLCPSWGLKGDMGKVAEMLGQVRTALSMAEKPVELRVSAYIRTMPFLWLPIEDEAGPRSLRGVVERNTIALLSNFDRPALDTASRDWLGLRSGREKVRGSGLWNQRHVDETYDPSFLDTFEELVTNI